MLRHARPCAGHPRLSSLNHPKQDGWDKPGHEGEYPQDTALSTFVYLMLYKYVTRFDAASKRASHKRTRVSYCFTSSVISLATLDGQSYPTITDLIRPLGASVRYNVRPSSVTSFLHSSSRLSIRHSFSKAHFFSFTKNK